MACSARLRSRISVCLQACIAVSGLWRLAYIVSSISDRHFAQPCDAFIQSCTCPLHVCAMTSGVQIDAAINSGNSGGPAFNDRGECVGEVTPLHGYSMQTQHARASSSADVCTSERTPLAVPSQQRLRVLQRASKPKCFQAHQISSVLPSRQRLPVLHTANTSRPGTGQGSRAE